MPTLRAAEEVLSFYCLLAVLMILSACPHTLTHSHTHTHQRSFSWSGWAFRSFDLTLPFVKRLKCSFACCTPLELPAASNRQPAGSLQLPVGCIFIFSPPEIVMLNGFSVYVLVAFYCAVLCCVLLLLLLASLILTAL